MLRNVEDINAVLQAELCRRRMDEVSAVEAARWLDAASVLKDSESRPGLPLRNLLRAGESAVPSSGPRRHTVAGTSLAAVKLPQTVAGEVPQPQTGAVRGGARRSRERLMMSS
jgi:hypothetical protein